MKILKFSEIQKLKPKGGISHVLQETNCLCTDPIFYHYSPRLPG